MGATVSSTVSTNSYTCHSVVIFFVVMAENNRLKSGEDSFSEGGAAELVANASVNEDAVNVSNNDTGNSNTTAVTSPEMKNVQDLTRYVELLLQQMQERFQTISDQVLTRIDDMGNRIDDLERNIADLVTQSGVEGTPGK